MSKLTGGFVNYYLAQVAKPQRKEQPAYQAECEDIIRALNMTFDEGCEFKAIWRTAAARKGNGKAGHSSVYDAEKRVHYASASLRAAQEEIVPVDDSSVIAVGDETWTVYYPGEHPSDMPTGFHDRPETRIDYITKDGTIRNGVKHANVMWKEGEVTHWRYTSGHVMPDGFIVHHSNEKPEELDNSDFVDVRYVGGGEKLDMSAARCRWATGAGENNITHYRLSRNLINVKGGWTPLMDSFMPQDVNSDDYVEVMLSNGHQAVAARRAYEWNWAYRPTESSEKPHITHYRKVADKPV